MAQEGEEGGERGEAGVAHNELLPARVVEVLEGLVLWNEMKRKNVAGKSFFLVIWY